MSQFRLFLVLECCWQQESCLSASGKLSFFGHGLCSRRNCLCDQSKVLQAEERKGSFEVLLLRGTSSYRVMQVWMVAASDPLSFSVGFRGRDLSLRENLRHEADGPCHTVGLLTCLVVMNNGDAGESKWAQHILQVWWQVSLILDGLEVHCTPWSFAVWPHVGDQ